jgi:hypothetical protein
MAQDTKLNLDDAVGKNLAEVDQMSSIRYIGYVAIGPFSITAAGPVAPETGLIILPLGPLNVVPRKRIREANHSLTPLSPAMPNWLDQKVSDLEQRCLVSILR